MDRVTIYKTLPLRSLAYLQKSKEDADFAYVRARLDAVVNEINWNEEHKFCDQCMVIRCKCKAHFKYDLRDYLIPYCQKCEKFIDSYTIIKKANSQLPQRKVLGELNQ
jgi:hypothetical protein